MKKTYLLLPLLLLTAGLVHAQEMADENDANLRTNSAEIFEGSADPRNNAQIQAPSAVAACDCDRNLVPGNFANPQMHVNGAVGTAVAPAGATANR
ncbi:MAG: hypothetical protein AAB250_08125 [Bdellovibrionota bacterium]